MRKLVFGLFLFVLVGAAWTAAWFYLAHEAGLELDRWLKTEDAEGRSWTCPDREIAGYPFALTIFCATPTFTGTASDQTATGTIASLSAEISILHPSRLDIALAPPLSYRTSDGAADIRASWSSLTLSLSGLPTVTTTTIRGRDVAIDGAFAPAADPTTQQVGKAARFDASFSQDRTHSDPTLDFAIAIADATVPGLDGILGSEGPVDSELRGGVTQPGAGAGARTPTEALDMWRQAGGQLRLETSRITHADASVSGSGTLGLDAAHRPQGRIDAAFVGLDPTLKRYGINANIAAAGSLLGALFGGTSPAAPPQPGTLALPISFQNGRLGIGPIRTPIALPPLY